MVAAASAGSPVHPFRMHATGPTVDEDVERGQINTNVSFREAQRRQKVTCENFSQTPREPHHLIRVFHRWTVTVWTVAASRANESMLNPKMVGRARVQNDDWLAGWLVCNGATRAQLARPKSRHATILWHRECNRFLIDSWAPGSDGTSGTAPLRTVLGAAGAWSSRAAVVAVVVAVVVVLVQPVCWAVSGVYPRKFLEDTNADTTGSARRKHTADPALIFLYAHRS
uniref:Uncharacterized protein n=1 Tax=Anopheles farauti TaxID=69004 RepID=A0A182R0C6_9DIPT